MAISETKGQGETLMNFDRYSLAVPRVNMHIFDLSHITAQLG